MLKKCFSGEGLAAMILILIFLSICSVLIYSIYSYGNKNQSNHIYYETDDESSGNDKEQNVIGDLFK